MPLKLTPSVLAWLRCFEAAARCGSFTRGASELCITQGAVSQQVKQLEDWLGRPLVRRGPRQLTLTPEGQWLAAVLRESLQAIEGTLAQLQQRTGDGPFKLSCSPSFALGWLTPRMGDFFRSHPGVELRVVGEFHGLDRERLLQDDLGAAVRYDLGQYRDLESTLVLDEWLLPVVSPAFLAAHPQLRGPADLDAAWLLHDDSPWDGAHPHVEWQQWLDQAGVAAGDLAQGHHFNLSQLALAAALAGQGLAMGRAALVLDDLAAGRLVAPFGLAVRSRAGYHFVEQARPLPRADTVRRWLLAQAAAFCAQRDAFLDRLASSA